MSAAETIVVPKEVAGLLQFVVWRYERRGEKRTKVPYTIEEHKARVDDPATWLPYRAALAEWQRDPARYQGIGLVVTEANGLTVWDLDHVLDKKTCEITDEGARWAVQTLASYTEITPSGEGLRIIVRGKLPPGRNRRGQYEAYSTKRYVTLTGIRYPGTPAEIREAQADNERVFEKLLKGGVDKLEAALRDAATFSLYHAKTDEQREALGFASHSEADLALLRRLAAYGDDATVDAWFRASALMRPKWERADYREKTMKVAREAAAKDVGGKRTDLGNALRFARLTAGTMRHAADDWFSWTGTHFARERPDLITTAGKLVIDELYREATAERDPDEKKAIFKHAVALESRGRFDNMLAMARAECFAEAKQFDADRSLLNVANGTLEMSRDPKIAVSLRPHTMTDLLTRTAPVTYDPKAKCPRWLKFLEQTTGKDTDLEHFLQVLAGYSISGYSVEDKLFYLYGEGANGKTTFVNTITLLLGEYASPIDVSTLLLNRNDPHPTGLADLRGLNLAVASELPESRTLNEDLIKRITGGDVLKARRMHENFFSFENHAKLWVYGNDLIHVRGTNHAIWRRMVMIPFLVTVPPDQQIKHLWDRLYEDEAPGILAWALRGFEEWREEGLHIPTSVVQATEDYRQAEDQLAIFLAERCSISGAQPGAYTDDVFRAYVGWLEGRGERPGTSREFTNRMKSRGIPTAPGAHNRKRYLGLTLETTVTEM